MNTSLATFLKIAVTAVSIAAFLFAFGYGMVNGETNKYKDNIVEPRAPLATKSYP